MQDLALPNSPSAAQDADALSVVFGEIVECTNLLLTSEEGGAEVQNLELARRVLALKVFSSGSEGFPGARSASCFPLIERFDNGEGKIVRRRDCFESS